jgi:hypothetical protein
MVTLRKILESLLRTTVVPHPLLCFHVNPVFLSLPHVTSKCMKDVPPEVDEKFYRLGEEEHNFY